MDQNPGNRLDPIADVPPGGIAEAYDAGGLDRLSDAELVAAVAAAVAEPRHEPADSFALHAPLELTARARLLDLTPPGLRRLARLRILSIAARDRTRRPIDDDRGPVDERPVDDPVDALVEAIARGDLAAVDRAARSITPPTDRVVDRLGPAIADRTSAAAHGPIFLATLTEVPGRAPGWLPLLRPLARELARHPAWRLNWIDRSVGGGPPRAEPDADRLFRVLADPPRLGVPGSTSIHPTMEQVDAPGVADELVGPVAGPTAVATPAAGRALTRVAALAMVRDTPDHAPYGWTHCLTLPSAVLTLAPVLERAGVPALAIAATHVLGFRASLAEVAIDPHDPLVAPVDPSTGPARRRHLVAEAARRNDAHIAKYVLAVLTAADLDEEGGHLYLAAGEHLLAVWDDRHRAVGADPDDPLVDEAARTAAAGPPGRPL
jgi:hypothetical protein